MTKMPFMTLYVDDFEADTAHLNFEEDGAYNRLLRLCWRTSMCSVPDDPRWIARRMRCDMETFHRLVEPLIKEFFSREAGRLFQKRQREEWVKATNTHIQLSDNGKKGARVRKSLKIEETAPSPAKAPLVAPLKHIQPEPKPHIDIDKEPSLSSKILGILGLGPAGHSGLWLTLPEHVSQWMEYGLGEEEILAVISRIASRPNSKPERPSYFTPAMHDAAMEKLGIRVPQTKARGKGTFRKVGT